MWLRNTGDVLYVTQCIAHNPNSWCFDIFAKVRWWGQHSRLSFYSFQSLLSILDGISHENSISSQTERPTERQADIQTGTLTYRLTDTLKDRQTDGHTGTQTDQQTHREIEQFIRVFSAEISSCRNQISFQTFQLLFYH